MSRRVFLFCILLLVLAAAYAIGSAWVTGERISRLDAAGNATAQSLQVLSALHALQTAVADIENGARGYALTGSDAYLQPFEAGRRQAPQRLDELRNLLRREPKQLARVETLTPLLAERIAAAEHGIAQKRTAPDVPFAMRLGKRGRDSDDVRSIALDIESDERLALAARKVAWQQELARARTVEAVSALSSLGVVALSLWALLRLRRAEAAAPAAPPPEAQPARASVAQPDVATDFDSLVDDALRRAAMLQASYASGSAERARIDALREAIDSARAGIALADARAVVEYIPLPIALATLARAAREREHCAVRESIDDTLTLPPAPALLLLRAAAWALDVLCASKPVGEIGVGLADDGTYIVVRVESPARAAMSLDVDNDAIAADLARRIGAAGGTWQWTDGETGRAMVAMLPALERERAGSARAESMRA
jgi:CHASE3 domain sensor protein